MHYIYVIQHISDLRTYVGQTKDPSKRWWGHKDITRRYQLDKKYKEAYYIHRAMAKYGIESFEFQMIEECDDQEEANEAEIFWVSFLQSNKKGFGFNLTPGGKVVSGPDSVWYGVTGPDHPMFGRTPHNKLFTDDEEIEICNKYKELISITKLGEIYNCTAGCIFQILKRNDTKILVNAVISKGKHYSPGTEFKKDQIPHNKLFTLEQQEEICKQYINGLSTVEIGKAYDCHKSIISRLLVGCNVKMRHAGHYAIGRVPPNKLFTDEQEKEICDIYINNINLNITSVARIYGCDRTVISDILDKRKIVKRSRSRLTDVQKEMIREEYKMGRSSLKLAKRYDVSKTTILRFLKEVADN